LEYSEQLFDDLSNHFSSDTATLLNLDLGIELGLAHMIMEAHKGRIEFESTGDGKGSVKMIFPLAEDIPEVTDTEEPN